MWCDHSIERKKFHLTNIFFASITSDDSQLKLWRNAEKSTGRIHPGKVTVQNIRQKLFMQLKIDLEDHEKVILHPDEINLSEIGDDLEPLVAAEQGTALEDVPSCSTEIKQLGDYYAKIYLKGGFVIPLHVQVMKR